MKMPISNFRSRMFFAFWMPEKRFLENKPKTGTELYASAFRCPQGIDAATHTTTLSNHDNTLMPSCITVSAQSEVST
jgi:hypothetical protein